MFKKELQAILKNKAFIVVIVSLMIIPALYNIIFLKSMWDPYGKLDKLPVAIVNQDQTTKMSGKSVNLGNSLTKKLKKDKSLAYRFVNDDTAQKGLKTGKYIMEVKIPSDFSKNASSLVSEDATTSTIHYQTTRGQNFIASKMSESAVEKLKAKVAKTITETYTKTIFENLTTLSKGVGDAADGSDKLMSGTQTLKSGISEVATNLDKLASSSLTFKDGADTLTVGLDQYMAGVSTLKSGTTNLSQAVTSYTDGASRLANGTSQLATGTAGLVAGAAEMSQNLTKVQDLVDGSAKLSTGIQQLSDGITIPDLTELKTGVTTLQTGIKAYNDTVQNAVIPEKIVADFTTLQQTIGKIQAEQETKLASLKATTAYQNATVDEQQLLTGLVSVNPAYLTSLVTGITDLQTQLSAMQAQNKGAVAQLSAGAETVLPAVCDAVTGLTTGLEQVKSTTSTTLSPGASQLSTGIAQLSNELSAGTAKLTSGAEQISQSTATLNTGAQALVSNNEQLKTGSAKLESGATQLSQKSSALLDGSAKLATGASQISSGSAQLASGGDKLVTGVGTLQAGTKTLNTGLVDAKTKLAKNTTSKTNAQKIADPVKATQKDKNKSEKNGVGMAPYMISVALFVGAISTNMTISNFLSGITPKNRRDYLKGKLATNGMIAIGEGVIVYLGVHLIGLSANHELAMFGFSLLVSICFMSIVTFFNAWLDKQGAFLMLILLLLQLGASAGTYPTALTNGFFQKLNPWIPMTYAVTGFRQVISLSGYLLQPAGVLLGLTTVFLILLSVVGYKKTKS